MNRVLLRFSILERDWYQTSCGNVDFGPPLG